MLRNNETMLTRKKMERIVRRTYCDMDFQPSTMRMKVLILKTPH